MKDLTGGSVINISPRGLNLIDNEPVDSAKNVVLSDLSQGPLILKDLLRRTQRYFPGLVEQDLVFILHDLRRMGLIFILRDYRSPDLIKKGYII